MCRAVRCRTVVTAGRYAWVPRRNAQAYRLLAPLQVRAAAAKQPDDRGGGRRTHGQCQTPMTRRAVNTTRPVHQDSERYHNTSHNFSMSFDERQVNIDQARDQYHWDG
jgi:hypothetical protein